MFISFTKFSHFCVCFIFFLSFLLSCMYSFSGANYNVRVGMPVFLQLVQELPDRCRWEAELFFCCRGRSWLCSLCKIPGSVGGPTAESHVSTWISFILLLICLCVCVRVCFMCGMLMLLQMPIQARGFEFHGGGVTSKVMWVLGNWSSSILICALKHEAISPAIDFLISNSLFLWQNFLCVYFLGVSYFFVSYFLNQRYRSSYLFFKFLPIFSFSFLKSLKYYLKLF